MVLVPPVLLQEITKFLQQLVSIPSIESKQAIATCVAEKLTALGFEPHLIGDSEHPSVICHHQAATAHRILKPLIQQKKLAEGARSSGQGDRCIVNTRDGKALQARWSNEVLQIDSTLIDLFTEYEDGKEVLGYRIVKGKEQEVPPLPGVLRLWLTLAAIQDEQL